MGVCAFIVRSDGQRHATLRATPGFGTHDFRVHGAEVWLAGVYLLGRALETTRHVEIESGGGPDENGQEQNADQR
jgi:hypothetical protein